MKRVYNILIIIFSILFIGIVTSGSLNIECLLKKVFNISCPGCGLTRSFIAIFHLKFLEAFNYNILGIPLFIGYIIICIFLIVDIILNRLNTLQFIYKILCKYYIVIIFTLIISMITNNIRGI